MYNIFFIKLNISYIKKLFTHSLIQNSLIKNIVALTHCSIINPLTHSKLNH